MSFHPGDELRAQGVFRNLAGDLADPTTVTISIEEPDGTLTPYTWAGGTVTRESLATFLKDFIPDTDGRWIARLIGTGAVAQTDVQKFIVEPL